MRYEYQHVTIDDVIENPGEYIIPECLDACKVLWSKGIETYMCSNHANEELYVSIEESKLDKENRKILYSNEHNEHFGRDIVNHRPLIKAQTSEKLVELAKLFVLQDSLAYVTEEEILNSYKRKGSKEYEILRDGTVRSKENPKLANATLEEALQSCDLTLYDAEEGKLFESKYAFEHHKKFKEVKSKLQN